MLFLISLAAAVLFTVLCGDILKKHAAPFYVGFTAAAVFFAVFPFKNVPAPVNDYVISLFTKGALAAAFFVLVMFAGAFKAGSRGAKKLMPIRAELAIAASLLTITHLISYGFLYTKRLITGAISPTQATITYFAIPLVILLIPLAVTSFKKIRKKMNAKKWKNLQRFAYAFYGLLYVHILIAYMPSARHGKVKSIINVIVYSAVFLAYAAMRISKALAKKHKESEKKIGVSLSAASAAALAAVSLIAAMPAVQAKTAAQVPTAETVDPSPSSCCAASSNSSAAQSRAAASSAASSDIVSSKNDDESSASAKKVSSADASSAVDSISSKSFSSAITSSKNTVSKTAVTSSAVHGSVQSENTTTEVEEVTENREEIQNNETEIEQETSSAQAENEPEVSSEEAVSEPEPEPEPEIVRIYNDGEYSAKCYEEDDDVRVMITVTITIENDRITDIKVDSDETDTWYIDNVLANVVPSIVEREGSALDDLDDIDAVSGATLSSNGVKRAVRDALDQARA